MKLFFAITLLFAAFAGFSQEKDSSAVHKAENTGIRITNEATSLHEYFIITITADSITARHRDKPVAIKTLAQLDNYLAKNIQNINKEKVAIEYPLTASFQLVDPVFDLLRKHRISKWRMLPL